MFGPSSSRVIASLPWRACPLSFCPGRAATGFVDYEKMFCPDLKSGNDIFNMRGIDRERGCIVVVRPDQYIAHVLPLDGHTDLAAFFDGFMMQGNRAGEHSSNQ